MKLQIVLLLIFISSAAAADHPANDLRSSADQAKASAKAAEEATQQARAAASLYLQAAESHCRELAAGEPEYSNAAAEADLARKNLQKSRTAGDSRAAAEASSRLNHALAQMKEMEAQLMATDEDVVQARAIVARLGTPAPVTAVAAGSKTTDSSPKQEFKHHDQIEVGMTKAELDAFLHRNTSRFKVVEDTFGPDRSSELMRVAVFVRNDQTVRVQGTFGVWHDEIQPGYAVAGYLKIEVTDGAVTEAREMGRRGRD
jgi:hypothetical protein